MAEYIPRPREWVRDQVELYERSGGRYSFRRQGCSGRSITTGGTICRDR